MAPTLTAVSRTSGANRALKAGQIPVKGASLDWVEVDPLIKAFRQMVRENAYDVCELALTTYICAKEHGARFTALPIFLVRDFHHGAILMSERGGATSAKDLEGRRVGVNRGYTVTTGVWARGILADEFDVDLSKVTWVLSGDEHVEAWQRPANVVPVGEGGDIARMLVDGEIAAAVGVSVDDPAVRPLVPDPVEAGLKTLKSRNIFPINHLVVVRDEVLEANPGLAQALFEAFTEAKVRYVEALRAGTIEKPTATDAVMTKVMDVTGDPLPYGIEPNRPTLDALVRHALAQGIITRPVEVDELFVPSTRALVG